MTPSPFPPRLRPLAGLAALAIVLFAAAGCTPTGSFAHSALPASDADPRAATALVHPADLAAQLKGTGEKPLLLHVGFQVLFKGGAIPGSRYAGPGSTPEGIAALKAAVKDVPKDRAIVIYCGCCPWDHCPNMRPAFQALTDLGFTHVRALYTPRNLETDWVDHGYPVEAPSL